MPPDLANDVAQLHFEDVFDLALFLTDTDDLVADLQTSVLVGGTTGHDLGDNRVAVIGAEGGTDSVQTEAQLDLEVLPGLRRHVAGMGIKAAGQGGQIDLELVLLVHLFHVQLHVAIPLVKLFAGLFELGPVELEIEKLILDPLPPPIVQLLFGRSPAQVVTGNRDLFVDRKIVVGIDVLVSHLELAMQPVAVDIEHLEGEVDVALPQRIIERVAGLFELVDIRLEEVLLLRVEILDEGGKQLGRNPVVHPLTTEVISRDHFRDQLGRFRIGSLSGKLLGENRGRRQHRQTKTQHPCRGEQSRT